MTDNTFFLFFFGLIGVILIIYADFVCVEAQRNARNISIDAKLNEVLNPEDPKKDTEKNDKSP